MFATSPLIFKTLQKATFDDYPVLNSYRPSWVDGGRVTLRTRFIGPFNIPLMLCDMFVIKHNKMLYVKIC